MKKILLLLALIIFLVPFARAVVSCTPSSISFDYTLGEAQPNNRTLTCGNDQNITVTVSKFGDSSLFSFSPNSIPPLTTKVITIYFNIPQATAPAVYSGGIMFSDGSNPVPITVNVKQAEQAQVGCVIDIFPTILTNIKLKQGVIKSKQILVTVPECYKDYIDIRAVSLESDEPPIQLGELSLGRLQPGSSVAIPLDFDATECMTGTYYETLQFNMANSSGMRVNVPSVRISVTVTAGITPMLNATFSTMPTCSLSAITMNLNSTYKFTCTNLDPNLRVKPIYSEYFKGMRAEYSYGQFIYEFQPTMMGSTVFEAIFTFNDVPIGEAFRQAVKIAYGTAPPGGVYLKFKFYPSLDVVKAGDELSILVADNQTGTTLGSYVIYLNGKKVYDGIDLKNNSFSIEAGQTYNLIGSSPGYIDVEQAITIAERAVVINIPAEIWINEVVAVITDPIDTILTLNGTITSHNITFIEEGMYILKAEAEGYSPAERNITAKVQIQIVKAPGKDEFKKGGEYIIEFNKEVGWEIMYAESMGAGETLFASGTSKEISPDKFKPDKKGVYRIYVDKNLLLEYETKKGFKIPNIVWIIIIGIAVVFIIIAIAKGKRGGATQLITAGGELLTPLKS